jgi:hypothetical protein
MKKVSGCLGILLVCLPAAAQTGAGFAYIGTLDKKLLVYDENKEEVVDEIPLQGIPRQTALSPDQTKLVIMTTKMAVEVVDLKARKLLSHFELADERSRPRGRSMTLDPTGRYLYASLRVSVKESDFYRNDPARLVMIDLQDKKIVKTFAFPPELEQGFGNSAVFRVSPDGKLLYAFDDDVTVFDLTDFKEVGRFELSQPEYPGASPYRLNPPDDPNALPNVFQSIFTAVDPVVHKGALGLVTLDLTTRKSTFTPIGRALPSQGFMLSPDRTRGYSIMNNGVGGVRETEFWVWDLKTNKVINKAPFESRPTFRFALSGDGKKIYLYGAGSSFEVFDGNTLKSRKLIFLNKDTTTNLVTLAARK